MTLSNNLQWYNVVSDYNIEHHDGNTCSKGCMRLTQASPNNGTAFCSGTFLTYEGDPVFQRNIIQNNCLFEYTTNCRNLRCTRIKSFETVVHIVDFT